MIRFNYTRQFDPPAPFVVVCLSCPLTARSVDDLPAQVDPAADRIVSSGSLVDILGLKPLETMEFAGLGGRILVLSTYRVELAIRVLSSHQVVVAAQDDEPHVLLGRDVLNRSRILFDGPGLALEFV